MANLLNVAVTTAVTAQVGSTFQAKSVPGGAMPQGITAQGTVTGSGGTSIQWWLQTSLDGGTTWCDVMSFSHTTAGRAVGSAASSPATAVAPAAATDGTQASAAVNNIFGPIWRVKYTSVGTWTTGNLRVDVFAGNVVPTGA